MDLNTNEKKKRRSKKSSGSSKDVNSRLEAVRVTIEKKKKCSEKALKIVTKLSEETVSEDCLLDNLQFINQEYYQDIVEERAINNYCGYPLCSNTLKNIPVKQYHISTTLNKVFDITDRKNFCSNLCYKASKYLKDQISTSPLWLREDDCTTVYKFISLQSKGGMSGEEVDIGEGSIKLDLSDLTKRNDKRTQSKITKNEALSSKIASHVEENPHLRNNDHIESTKFHNIDHVEDIKLQLFQGNCELDNESNSNLTANCTPSGDSNSNEDDSLYSRNISIICGENENGDKNLKKSELLVIHGNQILEDSHKISKPVCSSSNSSKYRESQQNEAATSNKFCLRQIFNSSEACSLEKVKSDPKEKPLNKTTRFSASSKKTSSKISKNISVNPMQIFVLKIEQILREWISFDSLCFIFGEEKIKDILAEKKILSNGQTLPSFCMEDVQFYERYIEICKKLNVLELEDTKIDSSYREEVKRPLPDYEALKEEARQMEIKVKMFYKGDKVMFEDSDPSQDGNIESESTGEPVLPLVEAHAQKALRRRIVIDKLQRVLLDLQKTLGLREFNLTKEVRTLVNTLTLSAHNITMKPAEWNLITLAVIKLLSLKDQHLAKILCSSTTNKHLTLLLMSFSLDAGYLDRLMIWLTDVEAVLKKN